MDKSIIAVLRDSKGNYITKVELIGWNDAPKNLELMALNYSLEDSEKTIGHYHYIETGKIE